MAKKKAAVAKRTAKKKTGATAKKATGHKHRVPGTQKKGPRARKAGGVTGLLGSIGSKPDASKKSDKFTIDLTNNDEALAAYNLLVKKDALKDLKTDIDSLEKDVLPMLDQRRIAYSVANRSYVGSVRVRGKGEDEDGNPFDTGDASFYIQNRYSGFDPTKASKNEELLAIYDGEATIRDEAVHSIIDTMAEFNPTFDEDDEDFDLDVAIEEASKMFDHRRKETYNISLKEGALALDAEGNPLHPEVIEILQEHLADWLDKSIKVVPTDDFHEKSNYDAKEMAILKGLNDISLWKRSKQVLRGNSATKKKAPVKVAKRRTKKA